MKIIYLRRSYLPVKISKILLSMKNKSTQRLLGVDLLRGIAAYAVVFVHSGDETLGLPISQNAIALRMGFYFAVPFFLATSFYFLTSRNKIDISKQFWRSRVERILIPYAVWSLIYVAFRSFFFFQSKKIDRLWEFLQDPLAIIFFGGASYQLYFLPLLFTGTFLVAIAKYMAKIRTNIIVVGLLTIFSMIIHEWLLSSGNAFGLNPNTAFQSLTASWNMGSLPPLRFLLVQVAWLIKCLPYIFMGMLLQPLCNQVNKWNSTYRLLTIFSCAIIFLLSNVGSFSGISGTLKDILQAYSLLLLSIALSHYIQKGWIFQSVGACSFGIYLIHPFAMVGVKGFLAKILPNLSNEVSIISMMTISIASFAIAWVAVALMMKNKWIAKYTLGV